MPKKRTKQSVSSADGFRFDEVEAKRAVEFCAKFLTHIKGEWAGSPLELADWEAKFIRELFGWKRADGTRKYRKALLFIARKNGKTTLGAAIALYLLFADREPGAEIYSVAADRDQAAIMFETARGMVENSPELNRRCEIYRRSIVVPSTSSAYHVLSADAPSKHGKNSHAVLFDELHAQPNRELYDVMKTSMGSRRQPLFLMFTTAGFDRTSVCFEEYQYACQVRDGIVKDDTYLPMIYECADKETADWKDENVWKMANPGLGTSPKVEFLREECRRASESVAYQNTFRRLYLNQWTEQDTRWLDIDRWDTCGEYRFDPAELRGRVGYMALDLSSRVDISAQSICFPPVNGGPWCFLWRFWIPAENIHKRSIRDRAPYDGWNRAHIIEATEGDTIDYNWIRARVLEDCEAYDIREIVYDRWGATQLITQLQADGLLCVPFGQGFASMSAPTKEFERLVIGRMIAHNCNDVMRWMIGNVAVRQDPAGNLKPDKAKSREKIDGVVAAVMALGRAMVNDTAGGVYDQAEPEEFVL
jgi:phage terminase large subunit-like protein